MQRIETNLEITGADHKVSTHKHYHHVCHDSNDNLTAITWPKINVKAGINTHANICDRHSICVIANRFAHVFMIATTGQRSCVAMLLLLCCRCVLAILFMCFHFEI